MSYSLKIQIRTDVSVYNSFLFVFNIYDLTGATAAKSINFNAANYDESYYSLSTRISEAFSSAGETRVLVNVIDVGGQFYVDLRSNYDNIVTNIGYSNYSSFLERFNIFCDKWTYDDVNPILKSATSDQTNLIACKTVGFNNHKSSGSSPYCILVPYNSTEISKQNPTIEEITTHYGAILSNVNSNFDTILNWIGNIDRINTPRQYSILYAVQDVYNLPPQTTVYQIYGISNITIKTVDKWYINTVNISTDGKTATPDIKVSGDGEVNCTFKGSVNNGASYSDLPLIGLTPNTDYHLFVKDQFDGVQDYYFTTTADPEIEVRRVDPYFKIENCNGLKYYEINNKKSFFDNAAVKDQLYFNTEMHCYKQPVLTSNIITTQIKSSYRSITAQILDPANKVIQTPVVSLKQQYIEQLDKRDCTFVRSVDGLNTYIYFNGGSVYEPNTLTVKETYTGSSVLPSFCRVGMFVELIGTGISGTYEVLDIIYDNSLQKWCLSVYYALPVATLAGIVQSTYNVNDWNIYEFDLVSSALSGVYIIKVSATDTTPEFVPVLWYSEPIRIASSFRKHLEITYTNPENINQIDYTTGIEHLLNVPGRFVDYDPSQESEDFRSDDNTLIILKRMFNRVIRLTAIGVPQYVAEKLMYASGHNTLRVNDYLCKCTEKPEIEIYEKSNLYKVSMSLQLDEGVIITDSTGIVSEAANVLGSETDTVIGL